MIAHMTRTLIAASAALFLTALTGCSGSESSEPVETSQEVTPPIEETSVAPVAVLSEEEICDLLMGDEVGEPDNPFTMATDAIRGEDSQAAADLLPQFDMMLISTDGDLGSSIDSFWRMLNQTANGTYGHDTATPYIEASQACLDLYQEWYP